jgi:hypothetical protein
LELDVIVAGGLDAGLMTSRDGVGVVSEVKNKPTWTRNRTGRRRLNVSRCEMNELKKEPPRWRRKE